MRFQTRQKRQPAAVLASEPQPQEAAASLGKVSWPEGHWLHVQLTAGEAEHIHRLPKLQILLQVPGDT